MNALKSIGKCVAAFFDAQTQMLSKAAAEFVEDQKRYPESQYWKGYGDGMRDAKELND